MRDFVGIKMQGTAGYGDLVTDMINGSIVFLPTKWRCVMKISVDRPDELFN